MCQERRLLPNGQETWHAAEMSRYARRWWFPEPVLGRIKVRLGFRQPSLRGLTK